MKSYIWLKKEDYEPTGIIIINSESLETAREKIIEYIKTQRLSKENYGKDSLKLISEDPYTILENNIFSDFMDLYY